MGRDPAADRRARRSRSCSTGWPTSRSTGQSYFAFALLGFGVWTYFSSTLQSGTNSLLYNAELLTKVSFPRIVAPDGDVPSRLHRPRGGRRPGVRHRPRRRRRARAGRARARAAGGLVLLVLAVAGPVYLLSAAVVKYRDASHARSASAFSSCCSPRPIGLPARPRARRLAHAAVPQPAQRRASACCAGRSSTPTSRPPAQLALVAGRRRRPAAPRPPPLPAPASASSRTSSDGRVVSTVIELDGVGKRYRLGEHHGTGTDLRETARPPRPPPARRAAPRGPRLLVAARRVVRRRRGQRARDHRVQRRRQEHAPEGHQRHHDADRGRLPHPGPGRLAARGRHRLPRRAHRASRTPTSTARSSG